MASKDCPRCDKDARASAFHDAVGQRQDCPALQPLSPRSDEAEPLMQEYQTTKLRVVDPIADVGVWAIVDDV